VELSGALSAGAHALVVLAGAIAGDDESQVAELARAALAAGVSPVEIDELVLQSVLTVGWPRALVAAAACRAAVGEPAAPEDVTPDYVAWAARGEATCRVIYGDQYDKLRQNVRALHPALEAWMITESYGRTLSRPGLTLRLRELCTVAQTAVLRTPRQLHSHLLGALRAGATGADVAATLSAVTPFLAPADAASHLALWRRIAASQEATT
jgi:4-carboxymuconolactone decarboxylase